MFYLHDQDVLVPLELAYTKYAHNVELLREEGHRDSIEVAALLKLLDGVDLMGTNVITVYGLHSYLYLFVLIMNIIMCAWPYKIMFPKL